MCGAFLLRLGSSKVMLEGMKNTLLKSWLLAALMFSISAYAGLYKGLDEGGNVVYSDTPFDNAKEITPPPLTITKPFKIPPKEMQEEADEEAASSDTQYTKFNIVSPTNDETIRNAPSITINMQIKPKLDIIKGDNIWLFFDGKPLVKNSQSLTIPIGRADRGSHTVQAQLRSKTGKIIKRSNLITIHVKNSVAPKTIPPEAP